MNIIGKYIKKIILINTLFILLSINLYAEIYEANVDNIYNDIRINAAITEFDFDLESVIYKKPLIIIPVLKQCTNCSKILSEVYNIYTNYTGLFYILVPVIDWTEVNYYREKYGDLFIYIPAFITSMKKLDKLPYIAATDKNGNILMEYYIDNTDNFINNLGLEKLINKIIKY